MSTFLARRYFLLVLKIVSDLMHEDLRQHLIGLRPRRVGDVSSELGPTLLSFSRQIALGMLYLSVKSFVHRDLAARNVLVSNDGTSCKIADFGLSRDLQKESYYISHGGKIPVKWTAPEALHYHKYSTASDVWSYGCVLYEIWSLGYKPFQDLDNKQVLKQVAYGYRLPPPPGCPKVIYETMIRCWHPDEKKRPTFLNIVVALQQPDFQILKKAPSQNSDGLAQILGAELERGKNMYIDLQTVYATHGRTRTATSQWNDDRNTSESNQSVNVKQNGRQKAANGSAAHASLEGVVVDTEYDSLKGVVVDTEYDTPLNASNVNQDDQN